MHLCWWHCLYENGKTCLFSQLYNFLCSKISQIKPSYVNWRFFCRQSSYSTASLTNRWPMEQTIIILNGPREWAYAWVLPRWYGCHFMPSTMLPPNLDLLWRWSFFSFYLRFQYVIMRCDSFLTNFFLYSLFLDFFLPFLGVKAGQWVFLYWISWLNL